MVTFARGAYSTLHLRLSASEQLELLDSGYLEDYYGNDGFLTLVNLDTLQEQMIPVAALPSETPDVPNDVFELVLPLEFLPNGEFELRGRAVDVAGNATVITSFNSPQPGAAVQAFAFRLQDGTLAVPRDLLLARPPRRVYSVRPYRISVATPRGSLWFSTG